MGQKYDQNSYIKSVLNQLYFENKYRRLTFFLKLTEKTTTVSYHSKQVLEKTDISLKVKKSAGS